MKKQRKSIPLLAWWGLRHLWTSSRRDFIGYVVCFVVQTITELLQLWVASLVVAEVGNILLNHASTERLLPYALASVGLMALDKVAWQLLALFERRMYLIVSGKNYMMFHSQLARLSVSQHNNPDVRRLIDRLAQEGYAWKTLNFSFEWLYSAHALLKLILTGALIVIQMPFVVVLLLIAVIPAMIIEKRTGDAGWGIWTDIGDTGRRYWDISLLLQQRGAIEEIIPQRSGPYLLTMAYDAINQYVNKSLRIHSRYIVYKIAAALFEVLLASAGYIWLITRVIAGQITLASFTFLSSLIWETLSNMRLIATSVARALENVAFMRDFIIFSELKNDLPMSKQPIVIASDEPITIKLEHVSFRYPRQKTYSLTNVSCTISAGDHIALVGENGAGKTTLIRLLLRFYDPTEGRILVNGHDLRDIDLDSYYRHIGTLFQVFNKYPLSFKDNITLESSADDKKYRQSLDIAGAESVLKALASEQVVLSPQFKDGADLSGGQWQRVAIARNLYAASNVYILDEPASAIDALSEQKIFEKLYRELEGKTLITISHRFNTVRQADTIFVLQGGAIVQTGSHSQLMHDQSSLYYQMFIAQAKGYQE